MSEGIFANRSPAATSDTDAERASGQVPSRPFAMAGPEAARMLLGLQAAAGNASVVQLLQRRASPTALRVPIGGTSGGSGFVDEGRRGTVPFADVDAADLDPGSDGVPHAFVTDKAGSIPYAGGGHGGGPHVVQDVGAIEDVIPPKYDTDWGGPFSKASAWVVPGTGTLTVRRSYETSPAGDQGTGWWVSPLAAKALNTHELEHVKASRDLYESHLQPVLDRVTRSRELGKEVARLSSTAKAYLEKTIAWEAGISEFKSKDGDNKAGGTVDAGEQAKAGYVEKVRYKDPGDPAESKKKPVLGGTVDDQFYEHLLVAPGEEIPNLLPLEEEPGALEHHAADDACPPCRALNGKTFDPGSTPPLPVPNCEREGGCRCGYLPAA